MPDYYQDHNNILGTKPRGKAPVTRRANPLVAALLVLACCAAMGALWHYQPGVGLTPAKLRGAVAYILAEFDDGQSLAGSGWLCGADGRLVTSRRVAFPQGLDKPPARYRVFLNSGRPNQKEYTASVVEYGKGSDSQGTPADRLLHDWALLKLNAEGGTMQYLTISANPQIVENTRPITICGYDPASQSVELNTVDDTVRNAVRESQGLLRFSYAAQPEGMDGGPVIDRGTGAVIGMNVFGAKIDSDATTGWALPVYMIEPLNQAAGAGN